MCKPGTVQLALLENLAFIGRGVWIRDYSGWHYGGHGNTERLMESLAKRGLVELRLAEKFKDACERWLDDNQYSLSLAPALCATVSLAFRDNSPISFSR